MFTGLVAELGRITAIEKGDIKTLTLSSGEIIQTRTIVVATGARWRELGVPGEKENIGNGVAYCPHCDGPFFKGKDVAVIGGGNSGIEAALDLSGIAKSVTVFEFAPELKADKILVDQAHADLLADLVVLVEGADEELQEEDRGEVGERLAQVEAAHLLPPGEGGSPEDEDRREVEQGEEPAHGEVPPVHEAALQPEEEGLAVLAGGAQHRGPQGCRPKRATTSSARLR